MNDVKVNYTKEAFLLPLNLVFLITAMVVTFFTIGSDPLGTLIPTFAMAAELLYLGIMPRQERFRRAVKAQAAAEHAKPPSEKDVFRLLSKANQKRYIRMRNLEKSIKANYAKLGYASQGLLDSHVQKLNGLLDSHLNLLHAQERYRRFSQTTSEQDVAESIEDIQAQIETDPPKVQAIKKRRLGILERRLEKFKKTKENLEVIEAQLETIEDVTKYIHEQSLTMSNPEEITFQLDTLLTEVEETQAAVEEVEAVFASPADLLGDMDTFDLETSDETRESDAERTRLKH
jgi:hypothetical protein